MFSSGTTGKPKSIVHSVGGTLIQHIKELGLHTDLRSKEKITDEKLKLKPDLDCFRATLSKHIYDKN